MIDKIVCCANEEEFQRRLTKLETDMYFGEGKSNPPITTRMFKVEQVIDSVEKLRWYFIAAIVAMIMNIISSHIKFN